MLEIRRAAERGLTRLEWLHSQHTFSFGHYFDPQQVGFSDLLVINEDRVSPGQGFGRHPHRDMEIFSYVLEGALEHRDSMGTGSVIHPGDVQMMSAGTGITHSEFNASAAEPVHFLQIWIVPAQQRVAPRYQQQHFSAAEKDGRFRLIIAPQPEGGALGVYQDVRVYAGCFGPGQSARFALPPGRFAYVHIARGQVALNGERLEAGDGVRVSGEPDLAFTEGRGAEVLVFDLRPQEQPSLA